MEILQASTQHGQGFCRTCPFAPSGGSNRVCMHVDLIEKSLAWEPTPPHSRIHHLYKTAVTTPHHHKMSKAARMPRDDQSRKQCGFGKEEMVNRRHDLFSVETKLNGEFFNRIDGGSIHVGLAGLTETTITDGDIEAFEEALQRGWPAVHCRCLYDFRRQETAARCGGVHNH